MNWASVLQLVGLALCATGAWLYHPTAGLIAAGASLFAVGFVLELNKIRGS